MAFLGCSCGGLKVLSIKGRAAILTYPVIDCLMATCRDLQGFDWPSTSIPSLRFSQAFVDAVHADFTGIRTSSGWFMSVTTQVAIFHEARTKALHCSSASLQVWGRHKRQGKVSLERHLAEHPGDLELPPVFAVSGYMVVMTYRAPQNGRALPAEWDQNEVYKGVCHIIRPIDYPLIFWLVRFSWERFVRINRLNKSWFIIPVYFRITCIYVNIHINKYIYCFKPTNTNQPICNCLYHGLVDPVDK